MMIAKMKALASRLRDRRREMALRQAGRRAAEAASRLKVLDDGVELRMMCDGVAVMTFPRYASVDDIMAELERARLAAMQHELGRGVSE